MTNRKGIKSVHNKILKVFLTVAMALLSTGETSAKEWDTTERQLRKLESNMLAAYAMLDFSTLSHIYADDYTYISDDGTLFTKNQVVEMVKTAAFRVDSIRVSSSRIRVFGNAAIIIGVRKFYRAGKLLATARYTEVWVNRKKRWQCVSGQLTPVQEKK